MKPIAMRKTCQDVGTGSYNPVMRLLADHNFGVWYLFWGREYGLWNSFWDILCHRNGGVTRRKLLVFETWSLFLLPKRIGYPPTNCITRGWKSQHLWESLFFFAEDNSPIPTRTLPGSQCFDYLDLHPRNRVYRCLKANISYTVYLKLAYYIHQTSIITHRIMLSSQFDICKIIS